MSNTNVEKAIPVDYDFGNFAVFDSNPLDNKELDTDFSEVYLTSVARSNVQLLVNQILQLPLQKTTESNASSGSQDSTMALFSIPPPTSSLPREKPLPKPKAPTKWEEFAEKKGIKKKAKDGKLVYDEVSQSWVPKWGYKGKNKQLDDQWLVEVDDKPKKAPGDELIDPRTLNRTERKRLVKKNQKKQEKNAKSSSIRK